MPSFISEDQIEKALLQKLRQDFGYEWLDCHTAQPDDPNDGSGRADKRDVVLMDRVRHAARRLNPRIPEQTLDSALEPLATHGQALALTAANREVYGLIRDGIPVAWEDGGGQKQTDKEAGPSDVKRVIQIMRDANYQGWFTLEFETKQDPFVEVPKICEMLRKELA